MIQNICSVAVAFEEIAMYCTSMVPGIWIQKLYLQQKMYRPYQLTNTLLFPTVVLSVTVDISPWTHYNRYCSRVAVEEAFPITCCWRISPHATGRILV